MANKNPNNTTSSRVSFTKRHLIAALVAALAALGVVVYLFRESLSSFADGVTATLGLGLVLVAIWIVVFVLAALTRRLRFGDANLWLSSAALIALILGIMGFFQPSEGALSVFTQEGDHSLGGGVGEAIIGSVTWLGVLRLLGIGLIGIAVTSPPLAASLATRLTVVPVYGYLFLAVAFQSVVSAVRGIAGLYRFEQDARPVDKGPGTGSRAEPAMPPASSSPGRFKELPHSIRGPRAIELTGRDVEPQVEAPRMPEPSSRLPIGDGSKAAVAESRHIKMAQETSKQDASTEDTSGSPVPGVSKVNRWWSSHVGETDSAAGNGAPPSDSAGLEQGRYDTPREVRPGEGWARPATALLEEVPEGGISEEEQDTTAETIRKTLGDYGVEVEIGQVKPGPTVTMYGLIPGWVRKYKQVKQTDESGRPILDESGKPITTQVEDSKTRVKVDNILSREKDLALALKTPSIRIETPVMGKSLVGIEVPNPNPNLVTLRSVMESEEFTQLRRECQLPIALGKGSGGETVVTDLAKMPHLLIAGATGSGKSACLNAIISCLLVEKTPAEMRLLLIDPKRVELTPYNGIPHLLAPVVVETDQVVAFLKGLIREMMNRYRSMEEVGVRNVEAYNRKVPERMPYLVVAVDELADLMMSAAFDVEQSLCRLAQLGRATGIHLIVATQRPSVDVVTGLIKANFPSRISFGVTSHIDSRTILDTVGAEKLLGRGDMLYLPLDASRPARAQGVFISDREIETLVTFWQTTQRAHVARVDLRAVEDDQSGDEGAKETADETKDELLDKAIELARTYNKVSTSLLQRRMRIGYPRAARLMDQLEEIGVVGPSDGSKSRDVIISSV